MNNPKFKKILLPFIIIFAVVIFLEIFVFNFKAVVSNSYEEIHGLTMDYAKKLVCDIEKENIKLTSKNDFVIKIQELDDVVKNLMLDVEVDGEETVKAIISARDEGNEGFRTYPERVIVKNVPASKYISFNLAGKATEISIKLKDTADKEVRINSIAINTKVPMNFSFVRVITVALVLIAIYFLRPSSSLYAMNFSKKQKKLIAGLFLLINILALLALVNVNPSFNDPVWTHHKQYHRLAEALSKGQFHLSDVPHESLVEMENPYDYFERSEVVTNKNFLWDHAYYEGKYYVYFGVVPCVLFYLPYYLVTGNHLPTVSLVFVLTSLCAVGIMLLMREILKRKFPKTPFVVYLMLCQMAISGGGLWLAAKRPDFYFVPIICAAMFTLFGLYFWIISNKGEKISPVKLVIGSTLMALVAGSRPQFLLASIFALFIFYNSFKEKKILSKKSVCQTLSFALPYLVIAALLMYYNFERFGSVFDFGANYNLTLNDMTKRGIKLDRTFLGWFSYFLQPINLTAVFPFIEQCKIATTYIGTTIYEEMYGGVLATNPFLWLGVLSVFFKKYFEDKKCYYITILCSVFALIVSFADTQMAGILMRYVADFNLYLYFGTAITFMCLYDKCEAKEVKSILLSCLLIGFFASVIYNAGLVFTLTVNNISTYNPELFYNVKHLVAFWQ